MTSKSRSKTSARSTSKENTHPSVFRSRSIDSISGNEQNSGGEGDYIDEKLPSSATLAKTFQTLRKRFSRASISRKTDRTRHQSTQNDLSGKSANEDSEASSAGEDSTPLSFQEISTSELDLTTPGTSTAVSLAVHRSLPTEKTLTVITSPPPSDSNKKNSGTGSSQENSNLSKTWSSSTFTGEQLHGKCSMEYIEQMKEKNHRHKKRIIDLRKDDPHQQLLSPSPITPSSKHSVSIYLTSYHIYTLTLLNTKGALT